MSEDRESTLCVCGEQNCPDHGSLKGRFDMDLTRAQALALLEAGLAETPLWTLMSYEFGKESEEMPPDEWVGLYNEDLESIKEDETYQNFALWLTRCKHVYDRNISTDGRDECVKCGVKK